MVLKLLLTALALVSSPAIAQIKLQPTEALSPDRGIYDNASVVQIMRVSQPREIYVPQGLEGQVVHLHKGQIISLQEATNLLDSKAATVCRVNLRQFTSTIPLFGDIRIQDVGYFSNGEGVQGGELRGRIEAIVDLESDRISNITVIRIFSGRVTPEYLDKVLTISPSALSSCLGTKVDVWAVSKK